MSNFFQDRSKLWIGLAFATGIILTLGYKDVYPDLERRYRQRQRRLSRRQSINSNRDHISLDDRSSRDAGDATDTTPARTRSCEIQNGIEGTIGNTPLIKIKSLSDYTGCEILAKAEFLNGAGNSPKDRVALNMIQLAEEEGLLVPGRGDCIYEGTVGSTGISLAAIARARGYTAHICMPSDQSTEKSSLLLKLGAIVERVPPASIIDTNQFVNVARTRAAEHTADPSRPGRGFFADQFENSANYLAHFHGTGPEIWAQCGGLLTLSNADAGTQKGGGEVSEEVKLDAFVAGAGTGGTISGVALFLKPRLPKLKVVLADPQGSGLYHRIKHGVMFGGATEKEGTRRRHQVDTVVEGIGVNRLTANFEIGADMIDDAVRVSDEQALGMARWLVEKDGIFVGSSSAVNCVAAVKVALDLGPGHRVVTILCDSGARHLSKFWDKAGNIGDKDDADLDAIMKGEKP